jgi:hypothetical protein
MAMCNQRRVVTFTVGNNSIGVGYAASAVSSRPDKPSVPIPKDPGHSHANVMGEPAQLCSRS